jgi:hypothetical protein
LPTPRKVCILKVAKEPFFKQPHIVKERPTQKRKPTTYPKHFYRGGRKGVYLLTNTAVNRNAIAPHENTCRRDKRGGAAEGHHPGYTANATAVWRMLECIPQCINRSRLNHRIIIAEEEV